MSEDRPGAEANAESLRHMARDFPPAAESGTPAPGEVGREAARAVSALIDAAERDFRRVYPEPHALSANLALAVQARKVLASLLSASPASETPPRCTFCGGEHERETCTKPHNCGTWPYPSSDLDLATPEDNARVHESRGCCNPASETPGPGEDDLRVALIRRAREVLDQDWRVTARFPQSVALSIVGHQWDLILAAVEQRTLADQKVARVEALRELSEHASQGTWKAMPPYGERPGDDDLRQMFWDSSWSIMVSHDGGRSFFGTFGGSGVVAGPDAEFLCAAVNYVRAALADPEAGDGGDVSSARDAYTGAPLLVRPWRAGDPCAACGSSDTGEGLPHEGAFCRTCGRSDDDD